MWQRLRDTERALAAARAETALIQHLLAQSLHEATDAVLLVDSAKRIRLANEQLQVLFGLTQPPTYWEGQPAMLLEAELRARLTNPAAFDCLLASPSSGPATLALRGLQVVEMKVQRLPAAAGGGYLLCCHDITRQRNLVQQLQTLAGAPAQHSTSLLRLNFAGEQVYANPAAERLLADLAPLGPVLQTELRALLTAAQNTGSLVQGEIVAGNTHRIQAVVVPFFTMGYAEVYLVNPGSRHQATPASLPGPGPDVCAPVAGLPRLADYMTKMPLGAVRNLGHSQPQPSHNTLDINNLSTSKLTPFDFCQVLSETLAPLAWQAQQQGLDFRFIPLGSLTPYPQVLGNTDHLSQVLVNLVGNALKFTPQGHVHVRSRVQAQTATTVTIQLEVADSGIGIAADKQALIFDAFAQANADIQGQYGGAGLGLSLSRLLVQLMGGTLSVVSQPGAGSTFTVLLTLPKAVPTPPSRPAALATWPAYACYSTTTTTSTATWPVTCSSAGHSPAQTP